MNSSVVLAAIVGLWLIWVGPYVLRIRRPAVLAETVATSALVPPARAESRVSQGSIMEMSGHSNGASDTRTVGSSSGIQPGTERPTIRRGRTSIAAVGAVALIAAVICVPLAALSVVPALLPLGAFVVSLLAVAGLRRLAIRDRRREVDAAFADAISSSRPAAVTPRAPAVPGPRRETRLFDAETSVPANDEGSPVGDHPTSAAPTLTATDLRQAALAVAASAAAPSAGPSAAKPSLTVPETVPEPSGTWQPVEVPKPMYVAAAKAERQAPAPLELPDAPKAQAGTSLKQGAVPPVIESPDTSSGPSPASNPTTGRMNLDDVLQRRRA